MHQALPERDLEFDRFGVRLAKKDRIRSVAHLTMDPKTIPIRELLEYCLDTGDATAWSEFVQKIARTISGVVCKRLSRWLGHRPSPDLVQDFVQSALLKLFDNDKKLLREFEWRHEDALYGFVKVISSRQVDDEYRKPIREVSLEEDAFSALEDSRSSEAARLQAVQLDEVKRSLEAIEATPRDKKIFLLYFWDGYTAKAISQQPEHGLREKDVENILARLARQVRSQMKCGKSNSASE